MSEQITNPMMRFTNTFFHTELDQILGTTSQQRRDNLDRLFDGPGGIRERLAQDDRRPKDD